MEASDRPLGLLPFPRLPQPQGSSPCRAAVSPTEHPPTPPQMPAAYHAPVGILDTGTELAVVVGLVRVDGPKHDFVGADRGTVVQVLAVGRQPVSGVRSRTLLAHEALQQAEQAGAKPARAFPHPSRGADLHHSNVHHPFFRAASRAGGVSPPPAQLPTSPCFQGKHTCRCRPSCRGCASPRPGTGA